MDDSDSQVRAERLKLDKFAAEAVSRLLEIDGPVDFVEALHRVPVIGKAEANLAAWQQPDAFLLTVFLNEKALVVALDKEIATESDDAQALGPEQRQTATATLAADMLACDRELSELIWLAQAEGLPHEFRSDVDALAVLSLQLVTAPHREPAGTSAAHAFDLVQPGRR